LAETTLKYGLTTPLRTFTLPVEWKGHCTDTVTGVTKTGNAIEHHNEFLATHHKGEERVFTIAKETKEVHIHKHITGQCGSHTTIYVEAGANVRIIETIEGAGTLSSSTVVIAGDNCTIEYSILQALREDSIALLNYEAKIQNTKLHWFFCGIGADTTQANIATEAGHNADVINNAVIAGNGKQQFDVHVATKHVGSHSRSNMLTRSVLDEASRAVYHGLINIATNAEECDSYQKDEVILLSDKASADAIPNLEINNNKVRCSHGASIGRLDQEKLFYFLSRGIEEAEAKRMITEGFLEPLFTEPWQKKIHEKISRYSKAE
jgi:Fe-S cluster assembly protein SufD